MTDAGSKSWVLRITVDGRRRDIGLGGRPNVGLADARRKATDYRAAVADGRNPLAEKRRGVDLSSFFWSWYVRVAVGDGQTAGVRSY